MYNEISFLFSDMSKKIDNNLDKGDVFDKNVSEVRFKSDEPSTKDNIINVINNSYPQDTGDRNPYISLLESSTFSGDNPAITIKPADIAYLTDLGVYPINRMIVLRRYDEGVIVPHNLNDLQGVEPISTIIGWVSPEDDKMFNIGFGEKWLSNTKLIHEVIADIIEKQTGIKSDKVVAIPGWAQGFLYQFLKEAGFVNEEQEVHYGKNEIPIGDPDVLRESATRDINNQGINSSLGISFKTSYEQKYIRGVDPGSAMLDIINNVLKMGIKDMRYMLGGNYIKSLMNAIVSDANSYAKAWTDAITKIAGAFVDTINEMLENKDGKSLISKDNIAKTLEDGMVAALRRFRWPLRSSLALMSGLSTTPWHMTLGNPFNPVISVGNILVKNGKIDFGNEMGFNDMPTKINVSFDIDLGRPLGKSEIMEILNNAYGRVYSKTDGTKPKYQSPSIPSKEYGKNDNIKNSTMTYLYGRD